jgi:hypothetical protein|tara:strand:+ start:647 stop:1021 length:375 start_codon:yes stop_codon:yes gene_type:complete
MDRKVNIKFNSIAVTAILNTSITSNLIWNKLPISSSTNTWGDEIYFTIPVSDEERDSKEVVDLGDIGYWPPGNAFCLFFGQTPLSSEGKIKPASPVNIIGKLEGDVNILKSVPSREKVIVEKIA